MPISELANRAKLKHGFRLNMARCQQLPTNLHELGYLQYRAPLKTSQQLAKTFKSNLYSVCPNFIIIR